MDFSHVCRHKLKRQQVLFDNASVFQALVSLSSTSGVKYFDSESMNWQSFPGLKLPSLQNRPAVYYTGNHLFLFDEKNVHQYQIDTNSWKTLPPMKNARHDFQVCMFEDFLYVIGGCEVNHTAVSERFCFSKKMWQLMAFHEEQGLYGCALVAHNGCIYSIGGSWAEGGADRGVFRFDPVKNKWTKLAPTVNSHTHACAFVVGRKLYVAGGNTVPPSKRQRGLIPSRHVEVYDEENNQWCSVPQPHIPPNNYGAVEIEGRIYFILGNFAYDSGIRIGEHEVYHVDIEDWEPISHHDADAVFVYMPVNRDGIDKMKKVLNEVEQSNELLLESDKP